MNRLCNVIFFSYLLLPMFIICRYEPYKAVVMVPVADLLAEPLSLHSTDVEEAYRKIPVSWGQLNLDKSICPRQHQALYNEVVEVVQTSGKEVCVEISNAFTQTKKSSQPCVRYWMLKKNLCPYEDIPSQMLSYIPQPIDFHDNDLYRTNLHTITLTWPVYDAVTRQRFSAGTRFVSAGTEGDAYATYVYDPFVNVMRKIMIPQRYACMGTPASVQKRITNFVTLLREWATAPGFIPLVWGGVSFDHRNSMEGFELKYGNDAAGQRRGYWQLHEHERYPHSGFDGSGLLLRAAQICGIPYFFKNSTTAVQHLRHAKVYEEVHAGDIVWIGTGLFVVSDVGQGRLIGALGYQFGFGKVVELSLPQIFVGISSFNDFMRAYKDQRPLEVKNSSGKVIKSVTSYALLKIKSLWECE